MHDIIPSATGKFLLQYSENQDIPLNNYHRQCITLFLLGQPKPMSLKKFSKVGLARVHASHDDFDFSTKFSGHTVLKDGLHHPHNVSPK
jgi:hypothetical protein